MAQIIDIPYQKKAESQALNKRFSDITGPCILQGFRIVKGNGNFSLTINRGEFSSSVAVTPSGTRVEETTNLTNTLTVNANTGNQRRVDSVYLVYQYGSPRAVATYEVVRGTNIPATIPNRLTHLLLAYVYVPENGASISESHIVNMPYGFSQLTVAGSSFFHGAVVFNQDVVFNGNVTGGGTDSGNTGDGTLIQRMPEPVIARENQTDFEVPEPYTMHTNTLFVYKNGALASPSEYMELTNRSFRFLAPLKAGDKVWAFWYKGLNVYSLPTHDHDDLYYQKDEILNRSVRYFTDNFAGPNGRIIRHNMNTDNYIIIAITPTEKTNNTGQISVDKRQNEIIVYNDGNYRGQFDLSYMMKPSSVEDHEPYESIDFTIESNLYNPSTKVYEETIHRRRSDGTIHLKTLLNTLNQMNQYTFLEIHYYNGDGTIVRQVKKWALTYDDRGNVIRKNRIL